MTDTANDAAARSAGSTPVSGAASVAGEASVPSGSPVGGPARPASAAPGTPTGGAPGTPTGGAPGTPTGGAPGTPGPAALPPALGMAERSLTRLLLDVLAETGTPELTWYAFQRLSVLQPAPTPDAFRRDLGHELELDDASAAALLDQIMAAGLMHEVSDPDDGEARIALTAAGEDVRARIRRSVALLVAELVEPFDPKDLEITTRTLTGLTERAREMHRRAAPDPRRAGS